MWKLNVLWFATANDTIFTQGTIVGMACKSIIPAYICIFMFRSQCDKLCTIEMCKETPQFFQGTKEYDVSVNIDEGVNVHEQRLKTVKNKVVRSKQE